MATYELPTSHSFVQEADRGVNASGVDTPLAHQRVISRRHVEPGILYDKQGSIPDEPLPETMLTRGYGNPVPDLLLFDHATEQTRLIIDVCQTSEQKNDLLKVTRLIEDADCGILEGFIYDCRTGRWFRYRKGDGGLTTELAFSACSSST